METHTKTHAHLSRLNSTEQEDKIFGCKRMLNEKGYSVKTFAYPYGEYDEQTLDILRNSSEYVLVRDTKQDNPWRNPKAITINQNPDYFLHFYYIRPEYEDAHALWERINILVGGNLKTTTRS